MRTHRIINVTRYAVLTTTLATMLMAHIPIAPAQVPIKTPPASLSAQAVGTSFVTTLQDTRVLRSPELVGAVLTLAIGDATIRLRIDAVERDPLDKRSIMATEDAVWLHTLSIEGSDGAWHNICQHGPDGRTQGFPLAGQSAPDGTMHAAAPGTFELVCSAGAQGKCVRFGYRPWDNAPDGTALRALYNACVHLVRGDYAGDNSPKTRNGMLIDIFDRWNIQKSDNDPAMAFEAGWTQEGAVCVHHPRVADNVTLAELEATVPHLRGRTGTICTEEFARSLGAVIYNRSQQ